MAAQTGWGGRFLHELPARPTYLGDEYARILDTKWVAGVIRTSYDAKPQRTASSGQADFLRTQGGPQSEQGKGERS